MKTATKITVILFLFVLVNSCGGGGGGSTASIPEGYSMVQINIGLSAAATKGNETASTKSSTLVPPDVTKIIVWDVRMVWNPQSQIWTLVLHRKLAEYAVQEGGGDSVVSLIENGYSIIYVQAFDNKGSLLYTGANVEFFEGGWYYIPVYMNPYTDTPPEFNGIEAITDITSSSMTLSWLPATDDVTPPEQIQYLIYMSLTPGGEDLGGTPSFVTDLGRTSRTVSGLSPNTTYYFVVRAMDSSMNTDSNTREMSATTLPGQGDGKAPYFRGLISATAASSTEILLTWTQAIDDVTPPEDMRYLIFMATEPGGEDFTSPRRIVKGVTSTVVTGLQTNTTYCFVARARDTEGNTDSNTVEKCATTPELPITPFVVSPTSGKICEDISGCDKSSLETLTVNLSGGVPPYSMTSGNPGVIPNAPTIPGNTFVIDAADNSIIANTVVTLTFRDSQDSTQIVTVAIVNEITVTPAAGGSICENIVPCGAGGAVTSESLSYTVSGGTTPYSVITSDANVFPAASITQVGNTFTFDARDCSLLDTPLVDMTYTLFFQDANGTEQTAPITVINQINTCITSFER